MSLDFCNLHTNLAYSLRTILYYVESHLFIPFGRGGGLGGGKHEHTSFYSGEWGRWPGKPSEREQDGLHKI